MVSKIEWTEETWNPITGCTKISNGCKNCYAEVMARRLQAIGTKGYENGFKLTLHPNRLSEPLNKKKPTCFFVNSMSDVFHEDVPFTFVDEIMKVIKITPEHHYQILTKRAEIMYNYFRGKAIPKNVWLGVTVEDKKSLFRIDYLRQIRTDIRFISAEPLLEDLGGINLNDIHWVIVGGESGSSARPMQEEWALNIKRQCLNADVSFFFKQWGAWGKDGKKRAKKDNGKLLDGKIWNAMPTYA